MVSHTDMMYPVAALAWVLRLGLSLGPIPVAISLGFHSQSIACYL